MRKSVMKLKKTLLNVYFWPLFGGITLISVLIFPFLLTLNVCLFRKPAEQAVRVLVRFYGWVLVRIVPFMAPVVVENKAGELPLPAIFVANHCSAIDPFLFGMLNVENAFVTTWPFKIPVYGAVMRMARYIDARVGWDQILSQGKRLLESNCSLTIWPEGHRSRTGEPGRFRKGAFQLAAISGRPVIPVCIKGSDRVLPPGKRMLNPGRVKVVLLRAIYPEKGEAVGIATEQLMEKARQTIEKERGVLVSNLTNHRPTIKNIVSVNSESPRQNNGTSLL